MIHSKSYQKFNRLLLKNKEFILIIKEIQIQRLTNYKRVNDNIIDFQEESIVFIKIIYYSEKYF